MNKYYKNLRTGEISEQIKIMQSDWDKSSDPKKIKDFFSYTMPNMRDIENGDILQEFTPPRRGNIKNI